MKKMKIKTIPNTSGMYKVSSDGVVYSMYRKGVTTKDRTKKRVSMWPIKLWTHMHGYLIADIVIDGIGKHCRVHRLVAEAFIKNPYGKRTVNHKNGNRKDNRSVNLEWNTHKENHLHAYRSLGRKNSRAIPIVQCDMSGVPLRRFENSYEAERVTKIQRSAIRKAANGVYKAAGGFIWKNSEKLKTGE